MSDWHNIELEASENPVRAFVEVAGCSVRGRCEHGFVEKLCPMPTCPHRAPSERRERKRCRLCGSETRLNLERLCAACVRGRKKEAE